MKFCKECGQEIKEEPKVHDGIYFQLRDKKQSAIALDITHLIKCGVKTVVFNGDAFATYNKTMTKEEMIEVLESLNYQSDLKDLWKGKD